MPTIILVRHGETHWNREKRVQGHGDSPLTLQGVAQAQAYGRVIKDLIGDQDWRLICSPLSRCQQTMAIICEVAGLDFASVIRDARIKEVSTGEWSGRLKKDMHPDELSGSGRQSWFFRCPGGETHQHMSERLSHWLAERQPGERVIAVSHGIAGKMLRGLYLGQDPDEALAGDSPQDALYVLSGGQARRMSCPRPL